MAVPSLSARERKRVKRAPYKKESTSGKSTSEQIGLKPGIAFLLLVVLICIFLLILLASLFLLRSSNLGLVPFHLHSALDADYSADSQKLQFPVVQLELIQDVMQDLGTQNPQGQYATLQAGLGMPVPSVTSYLPSLVTQTPDFGFKTPTATSTIINPVATNPLLTSSPTQTGSPTHTLTWVPTTLSTITPTGLQPTSTPSSVKTKTATVTKPPTTIPPKTPTKQPTILPTRTQQPPTQTNPPPTSTQPPPTPTNPPATLTNPSPTSTKPPPTSTPGPTPYPG